MKKLLITVCVLIPLSAMAQQPESMVEAYFVALQQTINQRDTPTLKQLVYPFKDEVEDMQAAFR